VRVRRGPALARIALDFADWDRRHGGCRGGVWPCAAAVGWVGLSYVGRMLQCVCDGWIGAK
jgi:hypothetical protein